MIRRQLVIIVAALALLGTLGLLTMTAPAEDATPAGVVAHQGQLSPSGDSADGVVEVVVVDDAGAPIPGATVTVTGTGTGTGTGAGAIGELRVDDQGRARIAADRPVIIRVDAPGHLGRAQAVTPGTTQEVVLTRGPGVSLRFAGDVMAGRRFFWAGPAGNASDADAAGRVDRALLPRDAGPSDHAALLAGLQPLLSDADLTVVNLETPLVEDPVFDPDGPRPAWLHPTKDIAFASSTALAAGLARAGVDVVSLGNNHSFDALGPGLTSTLAALDAAGVAHVGAGHTEAEAWAPAILTHSGRKVAFLGCTTVTGEDQPIPYVASPTSAGAAKCTSARLTREIDNAHRLADDVVVLVHGGVEYARSQTPAVVTTMKAAGRAGAAAVITSHPHVVGGIRVEDGTTYATTTGNLLFDQDLWSTSVGYLLRVDLVGGHTAYAQADPIALDGYLPRALTGAPAAAVARIAAGAPGGDAQLRGSLATLAGPPPRRTVPPPVQLTAGQVRALPAGTAAGSASGLGVRRGTDLLWGTGDVEATLADESPGPLLWTLGQYAELTPAAACQAGAPPDGSESSSRGIRLIRSPVSTDDVYATTAHRVPVTPGTPVTLVADVRSASNSGVLEIHWYAGAKGESAGVDRVPIPAGEHSAHDCDQVRLDLVVPDGVAFAQPFVRLPPTGDTHLGSHLGVDGIKLVAWAPVGASGVTHDVVTSSEATTVELIWAR